MKGITKKNRLSEIKWYIIVGILTTGINFFVFNLFLYININYKIANTIAFIVAVIFAYIANKKYVFKSHTDNFKSLVREFVEFVSSRILSYIIEMVALIVCVDVFSMGKNKSKIFISVLIVVINYIFGKIVFR